MKKKILAISLLLILIFTFLSYENFFLTNVKAEVHDPIHINGNAQFTSANGVRYGSGTSTDPYVIENWTINTSTAHGIKIENTDKYFIIRNCTIYNGTISSYHGIYFYNVTNGKIENVTVYNNFWGIYTDASSYNNISNSEIYNNSGFGIIADKASSNNNIANNKIYANDLIGIYVTSSSHNNIINNTIYGHSWGGIFLEHDSSHNSITNNILYNDGAGIELAPKTNNNSIMKNTIYNNAEGIYLLSSSSNEITKNKIYSNTKYGIYLYPFDLACSNNDIIDNEIYNNSKSGIYFNAALNNLIMNNSIYNNKESGVYFYNSSNNFIANSSIYNNSWRGIDFSISSNNNSVTNTTVYNNSDVGICFSDPSFNIITNVIVYNNGGDGIHFHNSSNNIVTNSRVYDNKRYGIYLNVSTYNNITNSNVYNNSVSGISFRESSNHFIMNNSIYNNKYYGVYTSKSSNNTIENNSIYNQEKGIYSVVSFGDTIANNSIYNTEHGIYFYSSRNNRITNNKIYWNSLRGIYFGNSTNNTITYNNISNNYGHGTTLFSSSNNIISHSEIIENEYGIYLTSSYGNIIHHNNIIENQINAFDDDIHALNFWDYEKRGNYWSDYTGYDENGDGIGEEPYSIFGGMNKDRYPFTFRLKFPLEKDPPYVISTEPSDNSIDVPLELNITINFSEPVNKLTIIGNISISQKVPIKNYRWSNQNKTVALEVELASYTKYTVTISKNVTDLLGNNMASDYQFSFRTKDVINPKITIISPKNGTITNEDVRLVYEVSDDVDSPANISTTPPNGTLYTEEGNYEITVIARDKANNTAFASVSFIIDKTNPKITIKNVEDGCYYYTDVTPIIEIFDDNLNDSLTDITLNGGKYPNGTKIVEEGYYILIVVAFDKAGNIAKKVITFCVDKTEPVIEIKDVEDGYYYNASITPSINISDLNLDENNTSIKLNDELFESGTTITDEGDYVLVVIAEDKARNKKSVIIKFTIDKAKPVTYDNIPFGWQREKPIKINLNASDNLSGIKETYYKSWRKETHEPLNWTTGNEINLIEDGKWIIKYYSVDKAGNEEDIVIKELWIDATVPEKPELNIEIKGKSVILSWNETTEENFNKYEIYIAKKVDFSDAEIINVTDKKITTYSLNLTLGERYYLKLMVIDSAGLENESEVKEVLIPGTKPHKIDILPTVAILLILCACIGIAVGYLYKRFVSLPKLEEKKIAPKKFAVEEVFLIYRGGLLISHTTRRIKADMDDEIMTGMLTAVRMFVKDAFGREEVAE
ncbi:MAG: right-handed parallel beta-helix repeat-containing protein, partial [Candidatus Thermoplasmatota archaeon]